MGIFVFSKFTHYTTEFLLSHLSRSIEHTVNDWLKLLYKTASLGRK